MKRVLLLTDFFRPEPGGLEALFTGIARAWLSDSIEVLATKASKNYLTSINQQQSFDDQETFVVRRPQFKSGWFKTFNNRRQVESIIKERIEQFKPEHVLFGDLHAPARIGAGVVRSMGLPYSVFLNGNDLKNRLNFLRQKERRIVLAANNVFTLSRFLAREARGYGIAEDRITVMPPFFEPRWPKRIRNKLPEFLKKKIGNKMLLLSVGPFLPRKGLDLLIQSFARLSSIHEDAHLLLAGSGPEFPYLQESVRLHNMDEHITLTGFVDDTTLAALWSRADIFVQPGREREDDVESLGTVFLEAAWFGIPVVAGRLGGVDEIVRHGVTGFVIEPGNRIELSEKIKQLVISDRLRQRFGKNALDMARRDFDPDRICSFINARL